MGIVETVNYEFSEKPNTLNKYNRHVDVNTSVFEMTHYIPTRYSNDKH